MDIAKFHNERGEIVPRSARRMHNLKRMQFEAERRARGNQEGINLDTLDKVITQLARESRKPSVWSLLCLLAVAALCAPRILNDFDFAAVLFVNKFVGKIPLVDGFVALFSDAYILNGVLFAALLWHIWFRDKNEESRIRLLSGGAAAILAGFLSRFLQLILPFHVRPLYNIDLHLTAPIGVGSGLSDYNCFPSGHASVFFALATLILINDRRLGLLALFWAAITSSTRIYTGYHYPTDILAGAVLGISMVIASQKLSFISRGFCRILKWERIAPSLFYPAAFIMSYQAGTFFNDFRAILHLLVQCALRHAS